MPEIPAALEDNLESLFQLVVDKVQPPQVDINGPLQMQISALDYSSYLGVIGVGRITRGKARVNQQVVVLDREGKSRKGKIGLIKTYMGLDNAEKREDSVKDVGALLDWIATQPGLDAKRVAVYGQSYGGYMSLASMTHYSDRFVGGVERYGISNWITFLNNTEAYRRDNRRAA